jgi:hypothetical protein
LELEARRRVSFELFAFALVLSDNADMKLRALAGSAYIALSVGLISVFPFNAAQAQQTIHIPGDAPTVQAGINMANTGDTVSIAPGTYFGPINFNGKAITVSGSGPGVILDGQLANGPVVTFDTGETRSSILQNVTVQNGVSAPTPTAGGIYIFQASPTILNSTIQNNQGCGIGIHNGAPRIQGNTIMANKFEVGALPYSPGCLVDSNNDLFSGGGGVVLYGVSLDGLSAEIIGNVIEDNLDEYGGGGVDALDAGRPFIENNTIANNTGKTLGSAIYIQGLTAPVIVQNLVYGNIVDSTNIEFPDGADTGAGLNLDFQNGTLPLFPTYVVNNTFVDNILVGPGPQIGTQVYVLGTYNNVYFYNNLIIGADGLTPIFCEPVNPVGTPPVALPTFRNNDVLNLRLGPGLYGGSCTDQTGQNGNISADPNFLTDASSPSPYRLGLPSPAIDSGDNNAPMLPQLDFLGQPRIQNATGLSSGVVDMGVYEYPGVPAPVPPPTSFTLTANPSALTVQQGQIGTASVTVAPTASNLGPVLLTCSGLPATVSCTFSAPMLNFSGTNAQSSNLTINSGTVQAIPSQASSRSGGLSIMLSGLFLIPVLFARRKSSSNKGAPWQLRFGALCAISSCMALSGCGKDKYIIIGSPQTYQLTVQAVSVDSGLSKQTSLTVVVTQ